MEKRDTCGIVAKKSYSRGEITINVSLRARGWIGGNLSISGNTSIKTYHARELAAELVRLADLDDAKVAAEQARKERRAKWQEREVAAGRMKIFSANEFFR